MTATKKLPDKIDRELVYLLHTRANMALLQVASDLGFNLGALRFRFSEIDARTQVVFTLRSRQDEALKREQGTWNCGFKEGDQVIVKGKPNVRYKVVGFTPTNVKMDRVGDGKDFVCKPYYLEKVGNTVMNCPPGAGL